MTLLINKFGIAVLAPLILLISPLPSNAERVTSDSIWDVCVRYDKLPLDLNELELVVDIAPSKPGGVFSVNWICASNQHQRIVMNVATFNRKDELSGFHVYEFTRFGGDLRVPSNSSLKRSEIPTSFWMSEFEGVFEGGTATPMKLKTFARQSLYKIWKPVSDSVNR